MSVFGKRMGVLVELNIIVFCFGTVIAYTVAVGDILKPLIKVPGRAQQPHLSHAHTSFDELIILSLLSCHKSALREVETVFSPVSILYATKYRPPSLARLLSRRTGGYKKR